MARTPLHELAEHDQSVWSDYLSRKFVKEGGLKALVDRGIVGVTSNPTIFQGAIAEGDAYDEQIKELSKELDDPREIFWQLAKDDIRDACDIMRPIWDRTGQDGWVSLEVDPTLANDTATTKSEARRLHDLVDRPNLYIKIPATLAGLQAIEDTIADGIPVNVTLIFSLARHREVAQAYIRGVKRFIDGGGDPKGKLASVASFFVSRVDTEADKRLEQIGGHDKLKGTLAIANAKLAYRSYQEIFSSPEWQELEAKGASKQRCLWASTSTKNPAYRDTLYVEELVGPETVNTMPRETIDATEEHGEIRGDTLLEDVDDASRTLDAFEAAGVSYDEVVQVLEEEGVEKFSKSFDDLIEGLESKLKLVAA